MERAEYTWLRGETGQQLSAHSGDLVAHVNVAGAVWKLQEVKSLLRLNLAKQSRFDTVMMGTSLPGPDPNRQRPVRKALGHFEARLGPSRYLRPVYIVYSTIGFFIIVLSVALSWVFIFVVLLYLFVYFRAIYLFIYLQAHVQCYRNQQTKILH